MAARERKLRWKFNASCLEAIASARCGGRGWRAVGGGLDDDPKLQIVKIEVHQRDPRDRKSRGKSALALGQERPALSLSSF